MFVQQCKEISLTDCRIGDFKIGDNCNITLQTCSVGSIIPDNIEDAACRVADLECILDDVIANLEDAETRLNDLETTLDE